MKRWVTRALIIALFMSASFVLFMHREVVYSIGVFLSMFYALFLSFGRVKERIRNSLPIFALIGYLYLGLSHGLWAEATWLFFFVPLISLMMKPKRNGLKYLTMVVSLGVFLYAWWFDQRIALTTRVVLILMIYVLFFPPYFIYRFERLIHRKTV